MDNLSELLFQNIEKGRGDRTAFIVEGKTYIYNQIAYNANRFGNVLKSLNIAPKSVVMLVLYDTPDFVSIFFGGAKIGCVMALVNVGHPPETLQDTINLTQASVVVIDHKLYSKIEAIRNNFPALKHVIVVGEEKEGTLSYERLISHSSEELSVYPTKENDPAFIIFTSGSTGKPKGVVHKHSTPKNIYETYGKQILNIQPDDITCSTSKMFLPAGFAAIMVYPFSVSAKSLLLPFGASPKEILSQIEKYKPTIFTSHPSTYLSLLNANKEKKYNISSLRLCVSLGEKLPINLYENWLKTFNLEIVEQLGCSELINGYISNRPGKSNPRTLGSPIEGYEVKLVDNEDNEINVGEVGIMKIKGLTAALYYLNNPEETKEKMKNGWIYTDDLFSKDKEGNFYLIGRTNDLFKTMGQWVSPLEIEQRIKEHPAVNDCLVVPYLFESTLVKPKALIVLNNNYQSSVHLLDDIKNSLNSKLTPYKIPNDFEFVDALPRGPTGKIIRQKMQDLFSQEKFSTNQFEIE